MNKDDIIRMAREAGFEFTSTNHLKLSGADWHTEEYVQEYLERFAALVAAAERERIIAKNAPEIEQINGYIKALEKAIEAEREACADICDQHASIEGISQRCAAAIRARGQA